MAIATVRMNCTQSGTIDYRNPAAGTYLHSYTLYQLPYNPSDNYLFVTQSAITPQRVPQNIPLMRFKSLIDLRTRRIVSVKLHTWISGVPSGKTYNPTPRWFWTHSYTGDINNITWNNMASIGTVSPHRVINETGSGALPRFSTYDITSMFVGDLANGDTFTLMMYSCASDSTIDSSNFPGDLDGNDHAPYIEVLTETYEQPAPTPTYPDAVAVRDTDPVEFSWIFNTAGEPTQTAVDIRYRLIGSGDDDWTEVNLGDYTAFTYEFEAGTFSQGNYEWQARVTNSELTISGWSVAASFSVVGAPPIPIISNPDNKTLTEIKWSADSQAAFEITLEEVGGSVLYHDTLAGSTASFKPNLFLNGTYSVTVRYCNIAGYWSDETTKTFVINAAGPDAPTITATANGPAVTLSFTVADDTQTAILRSDDGGTTYNVIALVGTAESYADRSVLSGHTYKYIARGYADGYTDSDPVTVVPAFIGTVIEHGDLSVMLDTTIEVWAPYSETHERESAATNYSGRTFPMVEKGEFTNAHIVRRFVCDLADAVTLRNLSDLPEVFYRDQYGNAFPVAIQPISFAERTSNDFIVTIDMIRVAEGEVEINV